MPIDYTAASRVVPATFGKLDSASKLGFPEPGSLSNCFTKLVQGKTSGSIIQFPPKDFPLLASAAVEMWHRAIHSFLISVSITKTSHLWASVAGYYSSHFVMRAFAHSMGVFKSFAHGKILQIVTSGNQYECHLSVSDKGEHEYYWKMLKEHPQFSANPLFRFNSQKDVTSDSSHRTFANYVDHLGNYSPLVFPTGESIAVDVEKISHIRLHSVTEASRDDYPDLQNVQILAFQRIVAFQDFLDSEIPKNRFWRTHRRPSWCRDLMIYQIEEQSMEQPEAA
jgi:hypothetical protein